MSEELSLNKITAEVITELAKNATKSLFEKGKAYFNDIQNKEDIDFGYAFENYLQYTKNINSQIKTLLYRHSSRDIYSFYECVGIKYENKGIDTSNVNNIIKYGHKLILTGSGGVGKSVLMKHIFLNCIENTNKIPILIELRGLNDINEKELDLVQYMYNVMYTYNFKMEKKYFDYSLEMGCYMILFDGFDEVKNNLSEKVTKEIMNLSDKYPENYYLVSSRPLQEFVGWNNFIEMQTLPLTKKQALSLIKKLDYEANIKEKFYKELKNGLYDKYQTFASNPLLLTIMLLTFENRVSIPDKLNDFYEQAFITLFHAHDARKCGYKRDILCNLGYEDFKLIFSYFCFKSFFRSEYEFTENEILEHLKVAKEKGIISNEFNSLNYLKDLTNSVCMIIHEGINYRFAHRSFQEYFAALYTLQLDDDQQKRFLGTWMKESVFRVTSNYLDMLYDLQPPRFIKNVLIPGLMEINDLYNSNQKSKQYIVNAIYSSVNISISRRKGKTKRRECWIGVRNHYFHEIVLRTSTMLKFRSDESEEVRVQKEELNKTLAEELYEKYGDTDEEVLFEELIEDGIFEDTIDKLDWIFGRIECALNFYNNYERSSISRKKKISSMLDEL